MNYQFKTHCPNCFRESLQAICRHCQFNRDDYLKHEAANHHLPLFTQLNKGYVVGRVLGEGGFAVVYAALREADNLSFAIKEYYPEALASRGLDGCTVQPKRKESDRLTIWQRRFEQEGELLRRCQDYPPIAGVVRFADLIKQHNTAYLAMERLHGNSLRLYLSEAKTAQWIISWLNPLLDTLAQLHGRAIFHRDISPNNVFLSADNKLVLMDFGLAREGIRDSALKSSTVGAGTEGFIAPEQTMEATSNRVDARTDLYSLGGLIYMALQGEPPPSAAHRMQGAPLKRCKNASGLTEQLEKLASHCLELDRDKRPENVAVIKKQYALLCQVRKLEKTIVPDQYNIPSVNAKDEKILIAHIFSNQSWLILLSLVLIIAGSGSYINYKNKNNNLNKADQKTLENKLIEVESIIKASGSDEQFYKQQCSLNIDFWQRAANKGNAIAQDLLGGCYYHGVTVTKNHKIALSWFRKSAAQGFSDGQAWLGQMYSLGEEVKQDYKEALIWYRKAAEQKHSQAECNLGVMYEMGYGVKQNYQTALIWYRKSAEHGYEDAKKILKELETKGIK